MAGVCEEQPEAAPTPRIVVAFGTRPEYIKLRPVVEALEAESLEALPWFSGQSRDLVGNDPHIWRQDDGLTGNIGRVIREFGIYLAHTHHDAVIVQGDTATTFACATAGFLAGIPVAHVEAGMRTYAAEPFPEEGFRRAIAAFARWHFAPDTFAAQNIAAEIGVDYAKGDGTEGIYVTGNTIIDTLPQAPFRVLVTLHRRENWGARIKDALWQLEQFAHDNYPAVIIYAIRHPNWTSWGFSPHASSIIDYIDPLPHNVLLDSVTNADLVVTDSGGLQEEAAHFGTPVLVLRTSTERVALERTGAVQLIDPDSPAALRAALDAALAKRRCYGDGTAAQQIAAVLRKALTRA